MKVDCDKLKLYTRSPKATTKITKQRINANKTKEIKWSHKKYSSNPRKLEKKKNGSDDTNKNK